MNLLSPQLEYIRIKQKDSEILGYFTNSVLNCIRDWFGNYYISETTWLAEFFYLIASLISSNPIQTPGQEHTSTAFAEFDKVNKFKRVLVSSNYVLAGVRFAPGWLKAFFYIFLRLGVPSALKFVRNNWFKRFHFLPTAEDFIKEVTKLNFAMFLITGYFDEISKRVLGLVYIKLQRPTTQPLALKNLGYLLLVQSFFSIYSLCKTMFSNKIQEDTQEFSENNGNTENYCIVCLSGLKNPTATPCGHIYCWECILTAVSVTPICPNCRQQVLPQSLLNLRNL